jgi:hypothetical protein
LRYARWGRPAARVGLPDAWQGCRTAVTSVVLCGLLVHDPGSPSSRELGRRVLDSAQPGCFTDGAAQSVYGLTVVVVGTVRDRCYGQAEGTAGGGDPGSSRAATVTSSTGRQGPSSATTALSASREAGAAAEDPGLVAAGLSHDVRGGAVTTRPTWPAQCARQARGTAGVAAAQGSPRRSSAGGGA